MNAACWWHFFIEVRMVYRLLWFTVYFKITVNKKLANLGVKYSKISEFLFLTNYIPDY